MKKAFTLIELLVVIAIIAILAAILFPVFAQAKEAAKKTQSLSNAKQTGTSLMIYSTDYDDLFPNANMYSYATNLYTWTTVLDTPADWRSTNAAWVNARNSMYPNNIQPYSKNTQILEAAGAPTESTWASATTGVARLKTPSFNSLTINGFLSSYSQTAVGEISRIPLLWYGLGKQRFEGYSTANPKLTCSGSALNSCVFSPTATPTAVSAVPGVGGGTFNMAVPNPTTAYVHSGGTIYVRTDTSTKFTRLASPNTTNNLTYVDPYANYNAQGVGSNYYPCATTPGGVSYSCIFRPDFDYNYNNWF
ncbi:MAG: prepilin-type N-terminal cleavage/methylation domain-containing protein [Fimbriimonadaceae bacterium]